MTMCKLGIQKYIEKHPEVHPRDLAATYGYCYQYMYQMRRRIHPNIKPDIKPGKILDCIERHSPLPPLVLISALHTWLSPREIADTLSDLCGTTVSARIIRLHLKRNPRHVTAEQVKTAWEVVHHG
jgi:hypothetical protein